MSSPDSLTRRYLSLPKDLWKLHCSCLTSFMLALYALWSAALLSASFQVSWEIQDARAFFGRGVLETSPFRNLNNASPSVWGCIALGCIGQRVFPRQ